MQDAILSILAHPDDAEILCGGTLIRMARQLRWQVNIATMTAGDCGSAELGPDDIARVRQLEGAAAAKRIGAHYHCLEERDLLIFYEQKSLARVTRLLRDVRPRIVLTHSPSDYMLDHEMTSTIVRAAVFAAPIPNFLREAGLGVPLQHIPHLYYCDPIEGKDPLGREVPPGFCIDVSTEIEEKAAMLACHASQREWLRKHHGMDHYIEAMRAWSAEQGKRAGVAYAEGFRQHLGHSYPQDNLLGQLLAHTEKQP
jgi:LmbE family N-acetylglucosaminyl deacetylase